LIRFAFLEEKGLALAAMSDKSDGNCGSKPEAVGTSALFMHRLGISPVQLRRLRQVHGCCIAEASVDAPAGDFPEADSIMTNRPGVPLGISVADCAPVLLYDPGQQSVAAIHSGREGVFQNIAAAGVRALCNAYGGQARHLLALVGPCAGPCCYEVSAEMAQAWKAAGLPACGRNLNLSLGIQQQLENAGVIRHNIEVVPHCTVCSGGFYSYRADKTAHRNLVIVML